MSESDYSISDMQEKSDTVHTFIERTDKLAEKLGGLEAVAPAMGISRAMLYSYRGGRDKITTKAWGKLEAAEASEGVLLQRQGGQTQMSDFFQPAASPLAEINSEIEAIQAHLARIAVLLKKI